MRCLSRLLAGDYDAAAASFEKNVGRGGPVGPPALGWGAAAHTALGHSQESAKWIDMLRDRFPAFSLSNWNFPQFIHESEARDRLLELMHTAGVKDD